MLGLILTIYIINLEKEAQLVHFRAIGEHREPVHEFIKTDVAAVISIKQTKETLSKK